MGQDEDDRFRALVISVSRPRGKAEGLTKAGRSRRVALSRRLRRALLAVYRARFEPGPAQRVLEGIDPANFRHREWRHIYEEAKIGKRQLKDLRDTFASQLLTAGIPLGYISAQPGHADVAVTARHDARWAGGDFYRDPMQREEGRSRRIFSRACRSPPRVP